MPRSNHICSTCGEHEGGSWNDETYERLARHERCHGCDFWEDKIRSFESGPAKDHIVIVDGTHFFICPPKDRGFVGHGGAQFDIEFFDGRRETTRNLWCQGRIPERFKDRLPDNARFGEAE